MKSQLLSLTRRGLIHQTAMTLAGDIYASYQEANRALDSLPQDADLSDIDSYWSRYTDARNRWLDTLDLIEALIPVEVKP